jgi:hypothetical protein
MAPMTDAFSHDDPATQALAPFDDAHLLEIAHAEHRFSDAAALLLELEERDREPVWQQGGQTTDGLKAQIDRLLGLALQGEQAIPVGTKVIIATDGTAGTVEQGVLRGGGYYIIRDETDQQARVHPSHVRPLTDH